LYVNFSKNNSDDFCSFLHNFQLKEGDAMKHEELIDFTQKILETNYLPVYRFTLPCENLEHLDQGLRYHILGVKNTSQFFHDMFEKLKQGKVYFNTDLFQCTFAFLLLPDSKTVF